MPMKIMLSCITQNNIEYINNFKILSNRIIQRKKKKFSRIYYPCKKMIECVLSNEDFNLDSFSLIKSKDVPRRFQKDKNPHY